MNKLTLSTLALAALASACGAVSNGGTEDQTTPTPTPSGGLTVADVQKGSVAPDTQVTLEGLVVTAIRVAGSGVDFWAQDAGGGPQSGIYMFDPQGKTPADIAIGDEVTVKGIYKEYYDLSEISLSSVEITDNGLTPTIDEVPLSSLGSPAAVEVWEGCLVEVTGDLTVASAANNYNEFPVTNGEESILVDDFIYDGTASIGPGAPVSYLAGVVTYSFGAYKVLPRSAADLVTDIAPAVVYTIADVQTGVATADTEVFDVEDAVVVAVYVSGSGTNQRRNFWIQQGAGPNSGVLVYDQAKLLPAVAVGDTVNVRKVTFTEFKGTGTPWLESMTELTLGNASVVEVASSGAVPQVTTLSLATLLANAEAYESVLVSLDDASITVGNLNPDAPQDYKEYTITNGSASVRVNDILADTRTGKTLGQSLTTRIGVLEYANNAFKLEPRSVADMQ